MASYFLARSLRLPARLGRSFRSRGVTSTLLLCVQRILIHLKNCSPTQIRISRSERTFDQRHGVETGGVIPLDGLTLESGSREDFNDYQATNPAIVDGIIRSLAINPAEFLFVDIGSGKGRILLVAAAHRFKKVLGIELARELHEAARHNVDCYRARRPGGSGIECICADAMKWPIPAQRIVFFLFNPFGARSVASLLANISQSLTESPRECYVIYIHPVHEHLFQEAPILKPVTRSKKFDYAVYRSVNGKAMDIKS
jgi:predicted RNA methylase